MSRSEWRGEAAQDWIDEFQAAVDVHESTKWRLGDLMIQAEYLAEEHSPAFPGCETWMHKLRQYKECAELWPESTRSDKMSWTHHWILRHHPKKEEWIKACHEDGIESLHALRSLLNR